MAHSDIRIVGLGLDFERYHPLEHPLRACPDRFRHVRLWWSYFGRERVEYLLIGWAAKTFFCRGNRHTWLPSWDLADRLNGELCQWCPAWR